jgi:hypothetical protein
MNLVHLSQHSPLELLTTSRQTPSVPLFLNKQESSCKELHHAFELLNEICIDMPLDQYGLDKGVRRKRCYSECTLDVTSGAIGGVGPGIFCQTAAINSFLGGLERSYESIPKEFFESLFIADLIRNDAELVKGLHDNPEKKQWKLGIHIIQNLASEQQDGQSTPEGIHQDGHAFIAMHFLGRKFEEGGTSKIYDDRRNLLFEKRLEDPFETLIVNDKKVYHEVTPFSTSQGDGFRNMLLIDFKRDSNV